MYKDASMGGLLLQEFYQVSLNLLLYLKVFNFQFVLKFFLF